MSEVNNDKLIPSATVVLLRDTDEGLEFLLLKRNPNMPMAGDQWVFPGGKLDSDELLLDRAEGEKLAAVRECEEECGVRITTDCLVDYSRWITPVIMPKRFNTCFYLAKVSVETVVKVDNSEIVDHQWRRPSQVLSELKTGDIQVRPPTFISVLDLLPFDKAEQAINANRRRASPIYRPKAVKLDNGETHMLYEGDAGYESGDGEDKSLFHRVVFNSEGLNYYRNNSNMY